MRRLTFQVDEEGSMAQQSIWGQVTRKLAGQVDPGSHHQLSQLGGSGRGFCLKTLAVTDRQVSHLLGQLVLTLLLLTEGEQPGW